MFSASLRQFSHRLSRHATRPQWVRTVFVQTADTPNPESLKFIPTGVPVLATDDSNGFYVTKTDPAAEILRSPLAKEILDVEVRIEKEGRNDDCCIDEKKQLTHAFHLNNVSFVTHTTGRQSSLFGG